MTKRLITLFAALGLAVLPAAIGTAATTYGTPAQLSAPSGSSPVEFGTSVAISADGSTVVVGDTTSLSTAGVAYVYEKSGSSWSNTATLTGGTSAPSFGVSVAISSDGSLVVVGDHNSDAAFVYQRPSGGWTTTSTPTATLSRTGGAGSLGTSVAMASNGSTIVVGNPEFNSAGISSVSIFTQPSGGWATTSTPTATLKTSTGTPWAFGQSLSISSDGAIVFVGDPSALGSGGGSGSGAVFVYERPSGGWTPVNTPTATLTTSSGTPSSFGWDVTSSADGSTASIGDTGAGGSPWSGAVFVYEMPSSGWATSSAPSAILTSSSDNPLDVGASVAMSADGSMIVAGDPQAAGPDGSTPGPGAAFVYTRPSGGWATISTPDGTITTTVGSPQDFGTAVDVSANGTTVAVGDPAAGASDTGTSYIFEQLNAASTTFALSDALAMLPQNVGFPTTAVGFSDVTLSFDSALGTAWKVRGQTAAWTASVQLQGDFVSGSVTVPGENLKIKIESGDISPSGSNPASNVTSFTALPDPTPSSGTPSALTILTSTNGGGNGIFKFSPEFQALIPGSTPSGSYSATLIATVVAGP